MAVGRRLCGEQGRRLGDSVYLDHVWLDIRGGAYLWHRALMVQAVVVIGVVVVGEVIVSMVTVNDMRGHVLVQDARDDLDAKEAANKAAHHQEAGCLLVPLVLGEVAHS